MKRIYTLLLASLIFSPVYADITPQEAQNTNPDYQALYKDSYTKLKAQFAAQSHAADPQFVFTPEELSQVAKIGVGQPLDQRFNAMLNQLRKNHPNAYMAPSVQWIFNEAGNVIGEIAIVYASTHEYVAFFGTPISTGGFSGRYPKADVYDIMVEGRMEDFKAGALTSEVYDHPGDIELLPQGEAKGMDYVGSTWMIDYGRGDLIGMFPFGVIAPALFQTLDYKTAYETLSAYAALVLHNH